ncbi:polysaccharide deacetylase family protein [Streptomyces sp. NPDC101062]|uniref:polysaccharide deacetylase family protein n=1 Tax=unclassified Streptomyces TaxID=2593676 RepID=UPI0037FC52C4
MPADKADLPDVADPRSGGPLWAVMYHSVADPTDDPYQVTVSPGRLERQLRWLRRRGLTGVSMAELLRARAEGRGAGLVGLTFDDGYADFVANAVPLLHEYGCTATVFVLPGRPGGTNEWDSPGPRKRLLTEDGVRQAAAAGMEIGSHGLLHVDLDTVDDATLAAETGRSRELLRELTGTEVGGFCYPYGTVGIRAVAAVRAAGYAYACAIDPGPLTGLFALPRIHVGERDTDLRLRLKWRLHHRRREPVPPAAFAEYAGSAAYRATAAAVPAPTSAAVPAATP